VTAVKSKTPMSNHQPHWQHAKTNPLLGSKFRLLGCLGVEGGMVPSVLCWQGSGVSIGRIGCLPQIEVGLSGVLALPTIHLTDSPNFSPSIQFSNIFEPRKKAGEHGAEALAYEFEIYLYRVSVLASKKQHLNQTHGTQIRTDSHACCCSSSRRSSLPQTVLGLPTRRRNNRRDQGARCNGQRACHHRMSQLSVQSRASL
jgi:hypothetical protein